MSSNEYPVKSEMVKSEYPDGVEHQFKVNISHCGLNITKLLPFTTTIESIRLEIPQWMSPEDPTLLPVPEILTRGNSALDGHYRLSDIVGNQGGSELSISGLFRMNVTNADHDKTVPIGIYNNMTFEQMRQAANAVLGDAFAIDSDAEFTDTFSNAHPSTIAYDYTVMDGDTVIMRSRPFDVKVRFNQTAHAVTVHKNMTLKQLHDQIASQYSLNTDFYMEIVNGTRLAEDSTPLYRMQINSRTVLSVQLMSGEVTQRIRYLCQQCGGDVWRANNEDVRCRLCGCVILFKTRAAHTTTQYIAR